MRIRTAGVVAAFAMALVACRLRHERRSRRQTSTDAAGGKLVIWADDKRAAALKPFAEKFGKDNGVTVEVQAVSKDLQTNFVTASQPGSGPGRRGRRARLDRQPGAERRHRPGPAHRRAEGRLHRVALKAVTFNGQLYGVPYAMENIALIRNTDLAPDRPGDDRGPRRHRQGAQDAGKVSEILACRSAQKGDAYHIYPLYTSGGGYLFGTSADGDYDPSDLGVGKPESVAAFTKIAALGEKGEGALKRSITGDNSISTFTGGKTAFLISGPWAIADIKKAGIKYDITPIPAFAGGKAAQPFIGVQAFYVASKGKNKALAQEFVTNYLTNTDLAVALYQADPRPPALTAALDQVKGTDPDLAKFAGRRQERRRAAGDPGDGRDLGPVRQGRGRDRRRRRRAGDAGRSRKTIADQIK